MKIQIQKKIGNENYQFEIEAEKQIDAMFEAGTYASIPTKCGCCGSLFVQLRSNKNQGYTFVYVQCLECQAKSQLGSYKDGGHFWKQFEIYDKANNATTNTPKAPQKATSSQPEPFDDGGDIPIFEE